MKKAYKFFRGMMLLLCCFGTISVFSQTFNGTGGAIPDNGCATPSEFSITVSGVASGASLVDVGINIQHLFTGDLDIYLVAPNGAVLELSTDNGGGGDNYVGTHFTPTASQNITAGSAPFTGNYLPEGNFSTVAGQTNGLWKLRVCDDDALISGTMGAWSLTFGAPPPPSYCSSVPSSNDGAGITNLTLGTTAFTIPDVTYRDLTASPVTLQQGQNVNVQIRFATGYTYDSHIWIDFNDNFTFEASERVYSGTSASTNPTILNASFPLSATATVGAHRMRIGTADSGQATPNPCYSGTYGVTIDATVNIIAPLCTSATVGASALSPDCSNNRFYVNVNVTAVNDATGFSDGTNTFPITSGVNQVGPFTNGSSFTLSVVHAEAACNFNVGSFSYNCPPANDVCSTAAQVTCGSSVSGSTQYANNETSIPFCGASSTTAKGVWYTMEGTGGDIVVSTAGSAYDTKLFVYDGSCGALNCVGGNDDVATGILYSEVTFESVAGQRYYIYVTGFSSANGNYNLSVNCVCEAEFNDDCATVYSGYAPSSSTTLTAVGQFGIAPYTYALSDGQSNNTGVFTVSPTATTTYEVTITDAAGCMSTAETTVVVVDVQCASGNGNNEAKVTICHGGNEICVSPNAVQAHLNHGDALGSCGTPTCETTPLCDAQLKVPAPGATNVSTDVVLAWGAATGYVNGYYLSIGTTPGGTDILNNLDVGNTLTYDPELEFGTVYYVTVTAYNNNGNAVDGCQESSFTTEQSPWCASATEIACGDTVNGNVFDGMVNEYLSACGPTINDMPGVWYKVQGTGYSIIASTCEGTNFDTVIAVFSGDCGSISCYANDDDSCDGGVGSTLASEVEFETQLGSTYYIFVTPFSSFTSNPGPFTLSLTCAGPPPPNQACLDAVGISCGQSTTGSTVGYEINDFDTCVTSLNTAPGRFYKVEGTGSDITVNTCGSSYDTKLGIFRGDCAGLICVAGNDDAPSSAYCGGSFTTQSSVTFSSQAGTVYYIYVTGYSSNAGNFVLNVNCGAPRVADPLAWTMYPNPATRGEVQLDLTSYLNQDLGIQLMDFSGKVLSNESIMNLQNPRYNIKTGNMSNGMYFVRIANENGVSTKKLIIAN
ncbi:T9SS type A sorting domain-containing protein [Subsaxibacter sp. CAU 1640]|uniref:T9SS type A sorting domain-containing protein n=1 Tax=Subsaxibacter sp. CAU 1640 TaxID=2933271 RepID=UPI002004AC5B|nr:T9SS type A sorting domain-containing protein [Subsaxibacter sp. CAU 1640]MCK7591764.1 T9SS type A sorting domain-containing protein [Subsaxibacter sp. CAU 1640]